MLGTGGLVKAYHRAFGKELETLPTSAKSVIVRSLVLPLSISSLPHSASSFRDLGELSSAKSSNGRYARDRNARTGDRKNFLQFQQHDLRCRALIELVEEPTSTRSDLCEFLHLNLVYGI